MIFEELVHFTLVVEFMYVKLFIFPYYSFEIYKICSGIPLHF